MNRRKFIQTSAAAAILASSPYSFGDNAKKLRGAIIGHTGHGNYGHELDLVFNNRPDIEIVAVADPDEKGRGRVVERTKALRQYADFRELLSKEKPDLVSIAPRWSEEHFTMAKAALEVGAHIIVEKPFTVTLDEADQLLLLAEKRGLKIAVAHQMRLAPGVVALKQKVDQGLLGELVQIRSWGKQDKRAGGEDMIVLGTHIFDMMRLFAGDAISCSADVWDKSEAITLKHSRSATEKIGPVAGDEIEARFTFDKGVSATFTSRARLQETLGPWAVELVGTKGIARILMDIDPRIYTLKADEWTDNGKAGNWQRFDLPAEQGFTAANKRVVDDWLTAIRTKREPACSGKNGMKALEMAMAVYESALTGKRVVLPLGKRTHPLSD